MVVCVGLVGMRVSIGWGNVSVVVIVVLIVVGGWLCGDPLENGDVRPCGRVMCRSLVCICGSGDGVLYGGKHHCWLLPDESYIALLKKVNVIQMMSYVNL
jgi:hypothetical protein